MPTSVAALRVRSIRAASPKFVGPSSGRPLFRASLVSRELSVSPAPSGIAAMVRAVHMLRHELRFSLVSSGHANWLPPLRFAGSAAPPDLVATTRAVREFRLEYGLSRTVGRASCWLALRAGVLRRAK